MGFPSLSGEQLLIIADVFCAEYDVDVADFSALYAAASVTRAQFSGIRVHTPDTVGPALAATIIKLAALTDRNAEFSEQVLLVYQAYLELFG